MDHLMFDGHGSNASRELNNQVYNTVKKEDDREQMMSKNLAD